MKNIIITGAANGVGKAVATTLKDNNLILIDEDEVNLKSLSESLNAKFYVCDLSDDSQIKNMVEDIKESYDKIDCLIDGQYIDELRDLSLKMRGSINQRIWRKKNGRWEQQCWT